MSLTPEMIADGWIEHDGKRCPVSLDSMPSVLFRDGHAKSGQKARFWVTPGNFWDHRYRYDFQHIIAYKPESPNHDQ